MTPKNTVVFNYTTEDRDEKSAQLISVLREGGFPFVAYNNVNDWHFKVQRRNGDRWDDVLKVINSVRPSRYEWEQTVIENETEYVFY